MENKPVIKEKGSYQVHFRGTECLNCGHPLKLSDRFCPNCSQANSTKKLSIKDFVDEFFANYFAYDSKLLRTLSEPYRNIVRALKEPYKNRIRTL